MATLSRWHRTHELLKRLGFPRATDPGIELIVSGIEPRHAGQETGIFLRHISKGIVQAALKIAV